MRQINIQTFVSLDGVMQAPGGPEEDTSGGFSLGGWSQPYWDDKMGDVMGQAMSEEYDLLLGRTTYDILAAHWPMQISPTGVSMARYRAAGDVKIGSFALDAQ